ncbi:MAG: hypothetical protein JW786_10850 [Desulfobacterales bacterium]|nr:hypothetical protein [Desulfobacterales bacterium]
MIKIAMETEEKNQTDVDQKNDDWQNRVLCSDGNCIGVIGSDGRCKECGKPFQEPELSEAPISRDEEEKETLSPTTQAETSGANLESKNDDLGPDLENDDWQNRVLCSDGNCIGVIGPDGRCKECGKPFQSE